MSVDRLKRKRMFSCLEMPGSKESVMKTLKTIDDQPVSNKRIFSQRRIKSKYNFVSKERKNLPIINFSPKKFTDENFVLTNQMKSDESSKHKDYTHRNYTHNTFRPPSRINSFQSKHSFKVFNFPNKDNNPKEDFKRIKGFFKKRSQSKIANENAFNYDLKLMKVAKKELFKRINSSEIPSRIRKLVDKFRASDKIRESQKKLKNPDCFKINGWETES